MIINEKGLARALKLAYKHGGYTLIANGEQIILFTEGWYLQCDKDKFPRKALATIVEHMGTLPTMDAALSIADGEEPQVVMPEGIAVEMADCIIRILDWAGKEGLDMDAIIREKMAYNKTRPYRHVGKLL